MSLKDTQSEKDSRNLAITRAGISSLRYPVSIPRPDGGSLHSIVTASLTVSVPASQRGTHMSRFVEEMHDAHKAIDAAGAISLAKKLRSRLHATEAHVTLSLPWFIGKRAPVSGREAFMDYEVTWEAVATGRRSRLLTTVRVPVGTLCPCSKAISDRGAHNQRGHATLTIETASPIWPDQLITLVEEAASCELFSLLKRPDEKFVTERAYDNPVFVEDLVREIGLRAARLRGVRAWRAEAENLESIHSHNAIAVIEAGLSR
jgi:GTP cyclohydrolase I